MCKVYFVCFGIELVHREINYKAEFIRIVLYKSESFTDNALKCFGWKEIKTEKWLVKCARVWYGVMSFIWFLFGALTFAPIAFMSNKVNAIVKDKKNSLLLGVAIYVCLICGIIILSVLRTSPS